LIISGAKLFDVSVGTHHRRQPWRFGVALLILRETLVKLRQSAKPNSKLMNRVIGLRGFFMGLLLT
jgi:hypothetical protein